jgi:Flp pilus assembly pilin Flp
MSVFLFSIAGLILRWLHEQRAQNTFEYLLIMGVVVVAMVGALMGFKPLLREVAGLVCPSVDTADPVAAFKSCLPH